MRQFLTLLLSSALLLLALARPCSAQSAKILYAGDDACRSCHTQKSNTYQTTAHYLTSQPPSPQSILGSFNEGKNVLTTSNPNLIFRMDSRQNGFYQTAVTGPAPRIPSRSEKFAAVIGSGRRGQSYLYWSGNQLFQLPVSYRTSLDAWINSPGYRDGEANWDKRVVPNCLGCHMSYATAVGSPISSNQYQPASLVFGISCERCHGSAHQHVDLQRAKALQADASAEKSSPEGIVQIAKLPRDSQINLCAQCHGGNRPPRKDPFLYRPGEPLERYYEPDYRGLTATADLHGDQAALLQMSKCYLLSDALTCTTCHDIHKPQRDPAALSDRCLTCHLLENCGKFPQMKEQLRGACANCHMPVQPSNVIVPDRNGTQTRATFRSHWIKIYR
jgi:hypothetical protein